MALLDIPKLFLGSVSSEVLNIPPLWLFKFHGVVLKFGGIDVPYFPGDYINPRRLSLLESAKSISLS